VPQVLARLAEFGKQDDRYGLIHSDLVPDNLADDGQATVIIDFDDCGFGWHLWEMATAVFWHLGGESYDLVCRSFAEGYREHRVLPERHLELLPTFLFLRGLVYLGWCHTRRETSTASEVYDFVLEQSLELGAEVGS
jgi:Ser/Thr protein kinase RdoA (MazF antagonist)